MNDPNRGMKWVLVTAMVVVALVVLYPPGKKLKGGIDLVGGTSLLFEIDTSGLTGDAQRGLSGRVMDILKQRVDPGSKRNLEWRPIGNSRLEIRMPLPPKEAKGRREAFEADLARLRELNVSRRDLITALNAAESDREAALQALVRGVPSRAPLVQALRNADDAYRAAREGDDPAVLDPAREAYEGAVSDVLGTNLPESRLRDVLELTKSDLREKELSSLREMYAAYAGGEGGADIIGDVVKSYDAWAGQKGDLEDPSDLKRLLSGAGVLEFRVLGERDATSPANIKSVSNVPSQPVERYTTQLARYGPRPKPGDRYQWIPIEDPKDFLNLDELTDFAQTKDALSVIAEEYTGRYYVLAHNDPEYIMGARGAQQQRRWKLESAMADRDPMTGQNVVIFDLDPRGGSLFGELTGTNVGRQLCIVLDDTAMSHATINERITTRCKITGNFTHDRVIYLQRTLEAGALPARLKEIPLVEKTIGPSLGATNRTRGMQAAIWGLLTTAVFVAIYYGVVAGGVAVLALTLNVLFVLAAMALMQATFTLPGIAGLILTVGMAVDANVLIFERFREERNRGVVFRKALNAGYDKALSTIVDANLTTLITCLILGIVGSEEIKGFAIVLGLGIVTSMFTSLFVTRLIFNSAISAGWLKNFRMLRLIGQPSIDWLRLRRMFWPISCVLVFGGMVLFGAVSGKDPEALYDIEFLGGTNVQLDLRPGVKLSETEIARRVTGNEPPSAVTWLGSAADHLAAAEIGQGATANQFTVSSDELTGEQIGALMRGTLEDVLERDGVRSAGHSATFDTKAGQVSYDRFVQQRQYAVVAVRKAAANIRKARVQEVKDLVTETPGGEGVGDSFDIATVETNRGLLQTALLEVLGNDLQVQQPLTFTTAVDETLTRENYFVVPQDAQYLSEVLPGTSAPYDVSRFKGGVAIDVLLDPTEAPVTEDDVRRRLKETRLRAGAERFGMREWDVFPLGAAQATPAGTDGFKRFAVVAVDESLLYEDDPEQWSGLVAAAELAQVSEALSSERTLSKVVQFAPQIAGQTQQNAIFAVVLAFAAIVAYIWLRFGNMQFGLAAIVALVHDVSITLGMVTLSHYLYNTILGDLLGMSDFKIDLAMIAAVLTVIGYSLNDTIVVFDRIRENRGKMGALTANVINGSINQTLSRTLLTSGTTLIAVLIMFFFGGEGIKGFCYALLVGIVIGTYSSIGIAAPLLHLPRLLHTVSLAIGCLGVIGMILAVFPQPTVRVVLSIIAVVMFTVWGYVLLRKQGEYRGRALAGA
jgi:SecD/SecF fusion protein